MGVRATRTIKNKAEENEKAKERMIDVRARQTVEERKEENEKSREKNENARN